MGCLVVPVEHGCCRHGAGLQQLTARKEADPDEAAGGFAEAVQLRCAWLEYVVKEFFQHRSRSSCAVVLLSFIPLAVNALSATHVSAAVVHSLSCTLFASWGGDV